MDIFKSKTFWIVLGLFGAFVIVVRYKPELIFDKDKLRELLAN